MIVFKSPFGKDTMLPRRLVECAKPLRASTARSESAMSASAKAATTVLRWRTERVGDWLSRGSRSVLYAAISETLMEKLMSPFCLLA